MHTNYHFLKRLVPELHERLVGLRLYGCFSQDKDEVVLAFAAAKGIKKNYKEFFIKADLSARGAGLFLTKEFNRAKRNSVSLWPDLYGLEVLETAVIQNDRSFYITLSEGWQLVFKLHGNRSNLLVLKDAQPMYLFHERMASDEALTIESLQRPLTQSFEAFEASGGQVAAIYPTLGKLVHPFVADNCLKNSNLTTQWNCLQAVVAELDTNPFYLSRHEGQWVLSLLPIGEVAETFTDPIEALNAFYLRSVKDTSLSQEVGHVLRQLYKRKKQTTAYLSASYEQLAKLEEGTNNEAIGHILMANLHEVPERAETVTLHDFYHDRPIRIKLKPDLSPQRNAENYYRKAKNERIEVEKLTENLLRREGLLEEISNHILQLEALTDVRAVRNYVKKHQLNPDNATDTDAASLFKNYSYSGFDILVGKNAKNNDLLTKKYAFKEDLWLHARDVAGSHVVVKYQAGKNFPPHVIEFAASLAAHYSKRKTEKFVPVIVTKKKFVRKPKGLAEGQVKVEKEEVVVVEPYKNA